MFSKITFSPTVTLLPEMITKRDSHSLSIIFLPILYILLMKTALVIVIGVLLWQSTDARKFTANALQSASDFIEPANTKSQTIGERIDSFLD